MHGFAYADVPDMGVKVLVVTDNQPDKGYALAAALGREFFDLRFQTGLHFSTIEDAVAKIGSAKTFPMAVG